MNPLEPPEPQERLLWSGRPWRCSRLSGERFILTDLRLTRLARGRHDELALDDIGDVHREEARLDRWLGTSTIFVHGRRRGQASLVLAGVRHGASLAAVLELLSDPGANREADQIRAALAWQPRSPAFELHHAVSGFLLLLTALFTLVIGLHGTAPVMVYAQDDAMAPGGVKRSQADIVQFMETDVMPWAREALGPLKGGPDRITCGTCHGSDAQARGWHMPAVAALPEPLLKERGWETYSNGMDAQMRNAIYGYAAESENQAKAGYMRKIVVPGMARLLHRPAYDFTRAYDYNRTRRALGCYHCHRVKPD